MVEDISLHNQITCPYCKRLITLPSIKLGSQEKCPHCELEFVVSHRIIHRESRSPGEGNETEGYGLKTKIPEETPVDDLLSDARAPKVIEEEDDLEEDRLTWRPMATPPPGLLLSRTFTFPFRAGSRICFLVLGFCTFLVSALAFQSYYVGLTPNPGSAWFISAMLTAFSIIAGAIWLYVNSAFCLTILRDTSEGVDKFGGLPSGVFVDMFEETFYVVGGIFWAHCPALIALALIKWGNFRFPTTATSAFIFFPLSLLSMLDDKSPAMPFSKPVWRSVWYAWHTWILFYLYTLLIGEMCIYLLRVASSVDPFLFMILISFLLPFFVMVYFRMLGRLAWFCSGRFEEKLLRKKNK